MWIAKEKGPIKLLQEGEERAVLDQNSTKN